MSDLPFGGRPAVLRCGRCGRFVDWDESRVQVVCGCRPRLDLPPVLVREAAAAERERALALLRACGVRVPSDVAALVAESGEGDIAGALAWQEVDAAVHIVGLATDPMWQRSGVGGQLVAEAELLARRRSSARVFVTITNDNILALYFYQRRGYRLSELLRDSVRDAAGAGFGGIPITDALRLSKNL